MILAALLLPLAVLAIVLLVQRLEVPTFLAIMFVVVAYGIAAQMTWQSVGKAFGQGFVVALEQTGLLVVAGSLAGTLLLKQPLTRGGAAMAGVLAGLGGSATAGLALLQPAARSVGKVLGLALTILIVQALVVPSPLAVAAAFVMKADLNTALAVGLPVTAVALIGIWLLVLRERTQGGWSWGWLAIAVPIALLIVQAVAQIPSEPLGKGGAREFYTGISKPLPLAVLAILLALALSRRWQPQALGNTGWAGLLMAVGAAGGLARVLDETGMAELLAERVLDPRFGLLAPFLAAAIVKTMQGNSLSAVLTASGMVEPMLPSLGLDSATGRALAAAAAGAGSIAICHVNDPFFWIAADMAKLPPTRALGLISLSSLMVAVFAVILVMAAKLFV
jgi:gluconate:H+ symporter, GntP family